MKNIPGGILGATRMVGQRFIELLVNHPWFEIKVLAASPISAGKSYKEAVGEKWVSIKLIPANVSRVTVLSVVDDIEKICKNVELVFSALDLDSEEIKKIENDYLKRGIFVVSNNSAHRWTEDVPMIIPEVNPEHLELINIQSKKEGFN